MLIGEGYPEISAFDLHGGGAWENTLKNEFKASIRESIALKQGHRQNTKKIQLFWLCQLKDSP